MGRIRGHIEILTGTEIEKVHESTLRILKNTGIRVPNDYVLDCCERIGGQIDKETKILKIPSSVMEDVLKKARESSILEVDNQKKLTGHISTSVFYVDYKTMTRRYGMLNDVLNGIKLVEYLSNIEEANALVVPSDVHKNLTDVLSYKMIYSYSTKPGATYILSAGGAGYIAEMSRVMGLRTSYPLETVSPLQFSEESLKIAVVLAGLGQRLHMGPMVIAGASGPVSISGTLTLQNTEALASLFVIYALTNEFSAYITPGHTMDLKTMLCSFGSPNQALLGISTAQLGRFYGLNSRSNAGLTDSIMPNFQAGFEKAANAIFSCLAGCNEIGCQGIPGADQGESLEQLVIDNEWLDFYNYILQGFDINEESMAVDIIERIGIGGNFMAEEHTVEHMRDNYWKSSIFTRLNWDNWKSSGARDILDNAHEFVNSVLSRESSMEPKIEQEKFDEINYIYQCAEKDLLNEK